MIALGCSNFFGSFFKIHVICCALSVTLAVDGAGGKSQVSAIAGQLRGEVRGKQNSGPREAGTPARRASGFSNLPLPHRSPLHQRNLLEISQEQEYHPYALFPTLSPEQVASLCVSLVVMITMLVLGSYLYPLPKVRVQRESGGRRETPVRIIPRHCVTLYKVTTGSCFVPITTCEVDNTGFTFLLL